MDVVYSLTLPIHTLYSQVQVPIPQSGNQPPDSGGGPLPSGVKTGRLPQHQPRLVRAPPEPERPIARHTLQPHPPMSPFPIRRGGHKRKKGLPGSNQPVNQSRSRTKQSQPLK
ncbi:hypothetical protein ILYODFUR_008370 [Ilyodon furcidens]|uniref:Uncharacterized protein n=1 Tax=Ilyodon furcidens TaxID=33524 RepID=A0ABV0V1D8_9TELE